MGRILGCGGLGLVGLLIVLALMGFSTYNGFVDSEENVNRTWSQVENDYQRRLELIPNLVNTVKGAADFERETLTEVTQARAAASQVTLTPEMLNDPAALQKFEAAQGALSSALSRLLVTVERYPELKANQNFLALQDELAGTENRISNSRRVFNEAVQGYNQLVRRMPGRLFASILGFDEKAYFQARDGAETAPVVEF